MQPDHDQIIDSPFEAALSERYLVYALSTITARSPCSSSDSPLARMLTP